MEHEYKKRTVRGWNKQEVRGKGEDNRWKKVYYIYMYTYMQLCIHTYEIIMKSTKYYLKEERKE
jgi:hypothetical protein